MKDTASISRKRLNAVSAPVEFLFYILVGTFAFCCVLPFIFVIIISFTDQNSLMTQGYSFTPSGFSNIAYQAAFDLGQTLWRSYFNSFLITGVGTGISVLICVLYAYGLYRRDYPFRNFFAFYAFFTMMFGGGLVPTVMVCRNLLGLNDNYAALIVPLLVNPFNFIIMRTFFKSSIAESLLESANIDGSGEFRTLFRIVVPIAKPGIATIALLNAMAYWNEWYLALLYINNRDLYPLQYLLMQMQLNIEAIRRSASMVNVGADAIRDLPSESLRMALCVFVVLPITCAYPFFQRYIISGLTIGAVRE